MSELGWNKLLALIIFVLLITPCNAQDDYLSHITLTQYPPGSLRIKYGGWQRLWRSELKRAFTNLHEDYLETIYGENSIEAERIRRRMRLEQEDIDNGGKWWTRRWFESLPESKGGAPICPIVLYVGRFDNYIDLGPVYLSGDLKLKFREYNIALYDPTTIYKPNTHWDLKIKPRVKFSTTSEHLVRKGSLNFIFYYTTNGGRIISITFEGGWRKRMGGFVGIWVSFLKW